MRGGSMRNIVYYASLVFLSIMTVGCSSSDEDDAALPPVAGFEASAAEVYKNEDVVFTNTSTGADTYLWDFQDGTTSAEESPTHRFSTCGNYYVSLTAFKDGMKDVESKKICVTSATMECNTISASVTGKSYFPTGKLVGGVSYKYCFKISVTCSYYGYKKASRWGIIVGSSYNWWEAQSDQTITVTIEHYTNSSSSSVVCQAYAVANGGNTYGDVFGATKTLKLSYL